ncbi:MAG: hypothetical protein Q4D57_02040 [Clostridia bacterium]|nr:hypothetical protein [Clostridia bacterium]
MDKQITKLDSNELLEVSGGMEEELKSSWARGLGPIDPESGKQEKREPKEESSQPQNTDKVEEEV